MLQPNFDPSPTAVRIHRCGYVAQCKARGCMKRATLIAEKIDTAGRHVREIELCPQHCNIVIERERSRGLEICDRRGKSRPCRSVFASRESKKRTGQRVNASPTPIGERGADTRQRSPSLPNCRASVHRPPEFGSVLI